MSPGTRNIPAVLVAVFLGLRCAPPEADPSTPGASRPSVIVISIDALRRDHLGHYGYGREVSPFLDQLAEESTVFERAYAVASWTLISHMTMMTGLYPTQHGVTRADTKLAPSIPLLSERLHELGYHTIGLTRGGWLSQRYDFDRGFDVFRTHVDGPELDANLREAMAGRPADRPLYLFLHVWDVHCGNLRAPGSTVYVPPEGYRELFVPDAVARVEGLDARGAYDGELAVTAEQVEAYVALYDGSVRYVDDLIASWIEAWRASGLLDDAILIVTSDHGEGLWQRGTNDSHGGVFEEGLRVPLMIRYPDAERAGERREQLVSHVDLVPTVLDYLEQPYVPWIAGRSLLRELPPERVLLAEHPPVTVTYRWPYKCVRRGARTWIYDLESDPGELSVVTAGTHPDTYQEILASLNTAHEQVVASWVPVSEESGPLETLRSPAEIEELRDLGYTDD